MRAWVLLLALLGLLVPVQAAPKRLIVVLLPGTSLSQWQSAQAPTLHRLMATGALAVMNTRTARLPTDHVRETPESALLTLNAGSRAAAPAGVRVGADWPALVRLNQHLGYDVRLGNLTDALAAAGIGVYAGGGPQAALAAASGTGQVRFLPPGPLPGGVVIWAAGPDPAAADALLDRFANGIRNSGGRLVVVSPSASEADFRAGHRLTPILVWGPGIAPGLLRSPSTHRAGLVASTDFAPAAAAYFGLPREAFAVRPFGQVWVAEAAPSAGETVRRLEAEAVTQARGQAVLPYVALGLALAVVIGTGLARRCGLSAALPLGIAAVLLALLLAASPVQGAVGCVALSWAAWAGMRRFGSLAVLLTLFGLAASALCLDMLTGSALMHRSLLGYSAIEGARYYGIGNEAMGLLVGVLLVLAANLWSPSRWRQGAIGVGLGTVCLLLGLPQAGAKAGGVLVSLLAFGALAVPLLGWRWTPRLVFGLGISAAGLLAGAVGADLLFAHTHSHLGEAARRIQTGGVGEAQSIILRKLSVEGRLLWRSAWAAPFWAGLGSLLWRKPGRTGLPADRALLGAGLTAIGACAAFNDAGVVAGALCVLPVWCGLALGTAGGKTPPACGSRPEAHDVRLY